MKKKLLFCIAILVLAITVIKVVDRYQINPIWWITVQNYKKEIVIPQMFIQSQGVGDASSLIAHGGGVGQYVYTNSIEAVENSIQQGFHFIEIDLLQTSDDRLVGGHDWVTFKKLTKYGDLSNSPLALDEVKDLKIREKLQPITGEDISELMAKYPDWILVTDKIDNFELILKDIPYPERIVVEVFSVKDYVKALQSGIKFPLFSAENVTMAKIARIYNFPLIAINIRRMFAEQDRIKMLENFVSDGVGVWGYYTTFKRKDDANFLRGSLGRYITKVYTDHITPENF